MSDCPRCDANEPSVFDGVLFHNAHPNPDLPGKLFMCHSPWRERCCGCSADTDFPKQWCDRCTTKDPAR